MPRSPFRVQTSLRSPHRLPAASPSARPDLPKLRVWGSNLSDDKFQFSLPIDKDQYFQLCSSFHHKMWYFHCLSISGVLKHKLATCCWLIPIYFTKLRKLKAILKQNSETRLWKFIKILFNFLKKKPAGRGKKRLVCQCLKMEMCVCVQIHTEVELTKGILETIC